MVTVVTWITALWLVSFFFFAVSIIFTLSKIKRVRRYVGGKKDVLFDKIEATFYTEVPVTKQSANAAVDTPPTVQEVAVTITKATDGHDAPGTYGQGTVIDRLNRKMRNDPNYVIPEMHKKVRTTIMETIFNDDYINSDTFKRVHPKASPYSIQQ